MTSIKPLLYKHKKPKDGSHPIALQFIKGRKENYSLWDSQFTVLLRRIRSTIKSQEPLKTNRANSIPHVSIDNGGWIFYFHNIHTYSCKQVIEQLEKLKIYLTDSIKYALKKIISSVVVSNIDFER